MSGGHFDYKQSILLDIAESVEDYVNGRELDDSDIRYLEKYFPNDRETLYAKEHHRSIGNQYEFSEETVAEFIKGIKALKQAYVYAQRIDWLLSGDDGEESFHRRLKEDLEKIK